MAPGDSPLAVDAGDAFTAAIEALVLRHMPLARALARRFGDAPPGQEDLEQAALVGLVTAARRFDAARGLAFSTYAVPVILGELRDTLRRASGLSGGRRLATEATRLRAARARLRGALGREPDMAELARAMGLERQALVELLAALAPVVSLDAAPPGRVGPSPADPDEAGLVQRLALARAMADLGAVDRRILALRYLAGWTQAEVARAVAMSQSQVSRREREGLRQLWLRLGPVGPTGART